MNVFLAGAHGVGKSFLGSRAAPLSGYVSVSASQLIRDERKEATWTRDKRVTDVAANQRALIASVNRENASGRKLLIDGHFVLFDSNRKITELSTEVFAELNLNRIVLLETSAKVAFDRSRSRGTLYRSIDEAAQMMKQELVRATIVSASLSLPLIVLNAATVEELTAQIGANSKP